jgi:nucleotide-binding universal stress UspA family protein
VSQGVAFHPIKKILFSFDDQAILNPKTIEALLDLALCFDAYVEIFTMFDLNATPNLAPQGELSAAKRHLETLLQGIRHGYSYENERTIDKGILSEALRNEADLVAMIPHHHSFLSNLFNLSETQRVATSTTLPLLVLGEMVKWPEDIIS